MFNATEGSEKFTFSPLGNTATKLAYWDEQAWVSELIVSSTTPKQIAATHDSQVRSASNLAAAAAENEGLLKPGKETEAKAKKRRVEASDTTKQKKVCDLKPVTRNTHSCVCCRLHQRTCNFGVTAMRSFMVSNLIPPSRMTPHLTKPRKARKRRIPNPMIGLRQRKVTLIFRRNAAICVRVNSSRKLKSTSTSA